MKLIGREREMSALTELRDKRSASLVVVSGRRRIGKSTLVQAFGRSAGNFYQFQGLAPRPGISSRDQLRTFSQQYRLAFKLKSPDFPDWHTALSALARQVKGKDVVVLLDEISWLGAGERDFPGILKIAWDTEFKNNSRLILVLCGSVSSWIERNILGDAGFVGRISLVLRLGELDFASCSSFWGSRAASVSSFEKLQFLSVTGGVPKYLEELRPQDSAGQNIKRLCFSPGGYLFEDFDRIFSDVFGERSRIYRQLVEMLVAKRLTASEIADRLNRGIDRQLSSYLRDLTLAGFVSRNSQTKPGQRSTGRGDRYRICDNYLRFYLRYVMKRQDAIKAGLFEFSDLSSLPGWDSIMGLQFENLVLNRLPEIVQALKLGGEQIESAGPYYQARTTRQPAAQVDLLISCRGSTHYICEIKFRRHVSGQVVSDMRDRLKKLRFPRRSSVRPVLIYAGELDPAVAESDAFDRILNVESLLERQEERRTPQRELRIINLIQK